MGDRELDWGIGIKDGRGMLSLEVTLIQDIKYDK